MKKMLSVFLALVMAFTCAFSAVAAAEGTDLKQQEADTVLAWLTEDISEENALEILTWDRDAVLAKLDSYDQPLEYNTKEEIADQFVLATGIFSFIYSLVESQENAEGTENAEDAENTESAEGAESLLGLLFSGLLANDENTKGVEGAEDAEGGEGLESLMGLFSGLLASGEGTENGEGTVDLMGLFSGLMGGADLFSGDWNTDIVGVFYDTDWANGDQQMAIVYQDGYYKVAITEDGAELSYLCEYDEYEENDILYQRLTAIGTGAAELDAEQPDHGVGTFVYDPADGAIVWTNPDGEETVFYPVVEEGEEYDSIVDLFNGSFWESGDLRLESVYQDGYYKVAITEGETELSYLCEYEELEMDDTWYMRLVSVGTGSEDLDEEQPDHGVASFTMNDEGELVWQKADGAEIAFAEIVDPLEMNMWYADGKDLNIEWWGGNNYVVRINGAMDGAFWTYECVLDEETDTLTGIGSKELYGDEEYADANGTFVFGEGRILLTWTDDKEPEAAEGLTFEMIEPLFTGAAWWYGDGVDEVLCYFADGNYFITVILGETSYSYVCTYDRGSSTLTAADPATLDPESLGEPENYKSTGSFELLDDDHLIWRDDSGAAGEEGTVLERAE